MASRGRGVNRNSSSCPNPPFVFIPDREREKIREHFRNEGFLYQRPYMIPKVKYTKGATGGPTPSTSTSDDSVISSGLEMYKREHGRNPVILYGQPYSGKTSMIMKLFTAATDHFGPKHWTRFVELRQLVDISKKQRRRPKSFLTLLAIQMKTTERQLKAVFNPPPRSARKGRKRIHSGELFLDGFDDIPPSDRVYFSKLFKQLRENCPIRVWITCRNYLKPILNGVFPQPGFFDFVSYSVQQQKEFLFHYWQTEFFPNLNVKNTDLLWKFTEHINTKLNQIIQGFNDGIGCVPIFLEIVAGMFYKHLRLFLKSGERDPKNIRFPVITFTEVIDKLVRSMMECYCFKVSFNTFNVLDSALMRRECSKILKLNSEYAIMTYPTYECKTKPEGPGTPPTCASIGCREVCRMIEILHDIGLIFTEDNGSLRFHHKMLGDYFLAKYYECMHAIDPEQVEFDRFYLQVMLFEREATGVLTFYDSYMGRDGPNPYNSRLLHDFLIQHYRLGEGKEEEWEQIKDNGNLWHLAVLQGYNQTARSIVNAFAATEKNELRKFLMIRAPLEVIDNFGYLRYGPAPPFNDPKDEQMVSSLGILALFGSDKFVSDSLKVFLQIFEPEELQREFNQHAKWSPFHYAACHANLWFINQIYGTEFQKKVRIQPGIFNRGGFPPLHLLITKEWLHVFTLMDCNLSDYDDLSISTGGGIEPAIAGSSHGAMTPPKNEGGKKREENKNTVPEDDRWEEIDFRFIFRRRNMKRDYREDGGNLQTMHACIRKMVTVGGEDINGFDIQRSMTLLHRAAQDGYLETTRFLLGLGANPNLQNLRGMTPLHIAAWYGYKDIFLDLIRSKAKLTIRDKMQCTPMMLWKKWGMHLYFKRGGQPFTKAEISILNCIEDIDLIVNGIMDRNSASMEEYLEKFENDLVVVLNNAGVKNFSKTLKKPKSETEAETVGNQAGSNGGGEGQGYRGAEKKKVEDDKEGVEEDEEEGDFYRLRVVMKPKK